ncbi:MAG: hypothetical protein ACRDBG_05510 [Waterburya sp.]
MSNSVFIQQVIKDLETLSNFTEKTHNCIALDILFLDINTVFL